MDQIKDKFAKETAALDEKIFAMKQSLAMKQVHLKAIHRPLCIPILSKFSALCTLTVRCPCISPSETCVTSLTCQELQKEATEAHQEATKATASLNRVSFAVNSTAAKNKDMTQDYKEKTAEANAKVEELAQEFEKLHAKTLIAHSKLQLAKKKFEAVSTVHDVAQKKSAAATKASETILKVHLSFLCILDPLATCVSAWKLL